MPSILLPEDYEEVRASLDVSLEVERLPDSVIAMAAYQGDAEREVKGRIPTWAALAGSDLQNLRLAVVLKTAARIAPAMPAITREDRLAFSYTRQATDWTARATQLNDRADTLIDILNPTPDATSAATPWAGAIFGVARSRRGGF